MVWEDGGATPPNRLDVQLIFLRYVECPKMILDLKSEYLGSLIIASKSLSPVTM